MVGTNPSDHLFVSIDLSQGRLKDPGNVRITAVFRKSESLSSAAGAIHVVRQEEFRGTEVTSVVDVLRVVPGLVVDRAIPRQRVIITSRGFNGFCSNDSRWLSLEET